MSIKSTLPQLKFNQMKILRVNFNLLWLSRFACEPLCILCGRPVTHRSPNVDPTWPVTWPDRQSAPVDRTGFHLWNKWLNFGGDPDHHLDTGIVFRIRHYWEIWKAASFDCAALAGIAIATMTSLHHRPTTDSGTDIATLVRHALAEVCTIPVLLQL